MKYFIIAGEQSGDLHGSNLVRELFMADRNAVIKCWGGDLMESAGASLLMHYRKTAFMGFVAVLKNLRAITANLNLCKSQITQFAPDVVILIDYPGFNLRIAGFAKESGIKVFYYISPKLWAWNEKRVEKVRRYVDRMYIIFPFEKEFYKGHGIKAEYMGNPLMDEIERRKLALPDNEVIRSSLGIDGKPVVALVAGSRRNEVEYVLPQMVKAAENFREYRFIVTGVRNLPDELYLKIIGEKPVILIKDMTYEVLSISEAALVTSGTATLETALFNIPQIVCFRGDFISMAIAWIVIKVKFISLVNLILGYEAVRELVQYSLNEKTIGAELKSILPGGSKRERMLEDYRKIRQILGPAGASARVAGDMIENLPA
ncbi:MAG: lipid-A-disaccharide synthase [Bacteroidales bacterium]